MDPIEELKNDPTFQKWPAHRQELVLKAVQARIAASAPRLVPRGAGPSASEDVVMRPGNEVDREQTSWNNRFDAGMGMAALAALGATGGPLLAGAGASASGVLRGDSIPGAIAEGAITAAGGKYLPKIVKAGAPLIRAALSRGVPAAAETAAEVAVPAAESMAAAAPKTVSAAAPVSVPVAATAPAVAQAAPAVAEASSPAASEAAAIGQRARDWIVRYNAATAEEKKQLVKGLAGKLNYEDMRQLAAYRGDLAGPASAPPIALVRGIPEKLGGNVARAVPAASDQVALASQWYKQYLKSDPRTRAQMVEAIGGKAGLDKVKSILSEGLGDLMSGPPGTGAGTVPGGFYGTPIVKPAR